MDFSMPGFPVYHQLLESTQTHVHRVSDVIQPSHPLSSPSPPVFDLSQHQDLFQWVGCLHQTKHGLQNIDSKTLTPKHWSFSFSISPSSEYSGPISFRIDRLDLLLPSFYFQSFTYLWSTTVWKYQMENSRNNSHLNSLPFQGMWWNLLLSCFIPLRILNDWHCLL